MHSPNDGGPAFAAPGPQEQNQTNGAILPPADAECKAFATLQAEAALRGCGLHRLDDGAYLLSKWNLCRELPTISAVRELLARIGGAS